MAVQFCPLAYCLYWCLYHCLNTEAASSGLLLTRLTRITVGKKEKQQQPKKAEKLRGEKVKFRKIQMHLGGYRDEGKEQQSEL